MVLCVLCGENTSEVAPQVDAHLQGASRLLEPAAHGFEIERLVMLVEGIGNPQGDLSVAFGEASWHRV